MTERLLPRIRSARTRVVDSNAALMTGGGWSTSSGLLREDFNLWFDGMLRLGGLSTDPDWAGWSVLDVGCGEGLFICEILGC